jgi:hypothetical protein
VRAVAHATAIVTQPLAAMAEISRMSRTTRELPAEVPDDDEPEQSEVPVDVLHGILVGLEHGLALGVPHACIKLMLDRWPRGYRPLAKA